MAGAVDALTNRGADILVGHMRFSKTDGSHVTDPQRDALAASGVDPRHVDEDAASGKRENRPGLAAASSRCVTAIR